MTKVFFVRHARPNCNNHDDLTRELSPEGLRDRVLVTRFLTERGIGAVLSSPYRRAVDTVAQFAQGAGLEIQLDADFRERRVDGAWIEDFDAFCRRQWADFDYKLSDGETLREVQERNIRALERVLETHADQTVAIGSHGTALSTVIHYYDRSFGYAEFERIRDLMPWVVEFTFEGLSCRGIRPHNLFEIYAAPQAE